MHLTVVQVVTVENILASVALCVCTCVHYPILSVYSVLAPVELIACIFSSPLLLLLLFFFYKNPCKCDALLSLACKQNSRFRE